MDKLSFPSQLENLPIEKLERDLVSRPESYWSKRGEERALLLFREMVKRVPAYKNFLKKQKFDPKSVKSIADFHKIPAIDKNNYLRKYPLKDLCWDGKLDTQQSIFSTTSGTTGEPFYFPRTKAQSKQYALTAELYLRNNFKIHKKKTLYIDGFAMGAWIGGLFTFEAIQIIADKGYPISIITPGVNSKEIIKAVKRLGNEYDQIILGGYPPFVKDTIDMGIAEGLNWKKYNLGIIFSAEGFNEAFRDYIAKQAGLKNIFTSNLNHYGTVDQGTHSHETPLAILVRRLAVKNKKLSEVLFEHSNRQPTLTQYMPEQFYFEEDNGNLYCSAFSGLPLVRYDLKDRGGVLSLKDVYAEAKKLGIDLDKEAKKNKIGSIWNLPFVYVFERSDMVVSWYGANIYPEHVREGHLDNKINKFVTGKFSMKVEHDKNHNPVLEIHSELKPNVKITKKLLQVIKDSIMKKMLLKNSEYKNNYSHSQIRNTPRLKLWPHQTAPHFGVGGKQKWTIK